MTNLRIAPGFALPMEAVTETFGIVAKRGSGKTYTAKVGCDGNHAGPRCADPECWQQ